VTRKGKNPSGKLRAKSRRRSTSAESSSLSPKTCQPVENSSFITDGSGARADPTISKSVSCDDILDAALLSMNRKDAAVRLGITDAAFDALMSRPEMIGAWIRGRAQITATAHAKLIELAITKGNITALKELLRRLDQFRDELVVAVPGDVAGDSGESADGRSTLRVTDFAAEFEKMTQARSKGATA
jgi:hypothetical protein